jgi:uncharacterized protein
MITVEYHRHNKRYQWVHVRGHALAGQMGKDLVCAAVSAIVIGGLNGLKNSDRYQITVQEGNVKLDTSGKLIDEDNIVIDTMMTQLKTLQTSQSKYITITAR